jgi:hypothetical protein
MLVGDAVAASARSGQWTTVDRGDVGSTPRATAQVEELAPS